MMKANPVKVKVEISEIVDSLPEEILSDLLLYLRKVEKSNPEKIRNSLLFQSIISEDQEVLQKLAK